MKPLIGITAGPTTVDVPQGTFRRYEVHADYTQAVEAAGGIPVALVPQETPTYELIDRFDALVFTGGGDVDPRRYNAPEIHRKTYGVETERDEFEARIFLAALERDIPVLCVCRGIQIAHVELGGSLIQDIPSACTTTIAHGQHEIGFAPSETSHHVTLTPGSLLASVFESTSIAVNSFHHQALARPVSRFNVSAVASDGIIEGVELPGQRWVLGVQWHPEMMFREHPEQLRPFRELVRQAELARSTSSAR